MAKRRKGITREFKLDDLRQIDQGRSEAEIACSLGVHVIALHGWCQQSSDGSTSVFAEKSEQLGKDEEIRELKKQPSRAEQEWLKTAGN